MKLGAEVVHADTTCNVARKRHPWLRRSAV
jgi:hypothetical protein